MVTRRTPKGADEAPKPKSNPGSEPTAANDRSKVVPLTPQELIGLAIPTFAEFTAGVEARQKGIQDSEARISLQDFEQLMANVKSAQINLTNGLNALSAYRTVVAKLLEIRRQEAAALRKAQRAAPVSRVQAVDAAPMVAGTDLASVKKQDPPQPASS